MDENRAVSVNQKLIPIENLGLSVRSSNALKASGIDFLHQITTISEKELKIMPNLGKKSINEIKDLILTLGHVLKNNPKILHQHSNLAEAIDYLLDNKFKKRKSILMDRLFNGHTLNQCGESVGVSRERIRQIESEFFKKLKSIINNDYINELNSYLENNAGIDGIHELSNVGSAYKNLSKYLITAKNPKVFLKFFFEDSKILRWQKKKFDYYLYPYESSSLDELINDEGLLNFINNSSSPKLIDSVKAYCLINNQENNFEYIFEKIQKKLSKRANFACLYAVTQLKKNHTYITTEQVVLFLKENCNKDFSSQIRTIDNILSSSDSKNPVFDVREINLYIAKGSGNYFFLDKLTIDISDKEEIVNFVLKLLERNPNKNFSSKEFYEYFKETKCLSEISLNILDTFVIDAILLDVACHHDILNYLGRSFWSGNTNTLQNQRIEIYPAVVKILKEKGTPMQLKDIKNQIAKIRGFGKNFQLHTTLSTPKIIQVSAGIWGLRDRDINVTSKQETQIIKLIKAEFKKGNMILNSNNIKSFRDSVGINEDVSVYQIMRLLLAYIPVGRRKTPDKLIFLFKLKSSSPLNFCFYSPEVDDGEASRYLEQRIR